MKLVEQTLPVRHSLVCTYPETQTITVKAWRDIGNIPVFP